MLCPRVHTRAASSRPDQTYLQVMFTMLLAFFVIVGRLETENGTISSYPQIISIAQVRSPRACTGGGFAQPTVACA